MEAWRVLRDVSKASRHRRKSRVSRRSKSMVSECSCRMIRRYSMLPTSRFEAAEGQEWPSVRIKNRGSVVNADLHRREKRSGEVWVCFCHGEVSSSISHLPIREEKQSSGARRFPGIRQEQDS